MKIGIRKKNIRYYLNIGADMPSTIDLNKNPAAIMSAPLASFVLIGDETFFMQHAIGQPPNIVRLMSTKLENKKLGEVEIFTRKEPRLLRAPSGKSDMDRGEICVLLKNRIHVVR